MESKSETTSNGIAIDGARQVDLAEAARQLQLAMHDALVAFDCIGLEEFHRAHIHAITARVEADAAEKALRVALSEGRASAGK